MKKLKNRRHGTGRILRFAAILLLLFILTIGAVYAEDEPKEITLIWSNKVNFTYDGEPHAPTVEIAPGQISEGDDVGVTRTMEIEPGDYTSEAQLTGEDSGKYIIKSDCRSKDYTITAPYNVHFDANPPESASTKQYLKGSMLDQHFEFNEEKALDPNTFRLPGYTFNSWNTEPDGTGTKYDYTKPVKNLSETGGTVTLYAQWEKQKYNILFKYSNEENLFGLHQQELEFDTPTNLDTYSNQSFNWAPPLNSELHGWYWDDTGVVSFFTDGAECINLCAKDPDGRPVLVNDEDLVGATLVAEWVDPGQINVSVMLDGTSQSGLKDYFKLVSDSGSTYTVDWTYDKGRYIYDPEDQPPGPGGAPKQLPRDGYYLVLDPGKTDPADPLYKFAKSSIHIQYGEASAVSTTFKYYTVSLAPDSEYEKLHTVDISGGRQILDDPKTVVAPIGSKLQIKTMIDPGYHFDGYSVSGTAPGWDPDKAEQEITVQGKADIMAHIDANVYTVKFNANATSGVSGTMEDQDMVYSEPQNLFANQFKRTNATFKGWNTEKNGGGTAYEDGQRVQDLTTEDNGVVTLYAQWDGGDSEDWNAPVTQSSDVLLAKMKAKGKKSMTISWNEVNGAEGYDIFLARCNGKDMTAANMVKTIEAGKPLKWTKKGLKKKTAYKVYVKAYTVKDGNKTYIKTSPLMHAYTSGASKKYSNAKALTVNKAEVALKTGETFEVKAKITKVKKHRKFMPGKHVSKLRYLCSDENVADVSTSGTITAKAKGTCVVYVYTHNGISKKITVTVK